jgi:hypothetical protein
MITADVFGSLTDLRGSWTGRRAKGPMQPPDSDFGTEIIDAGL